MDKYITIPLSKTGNKYRGLYETKVSPEDIDLSNLDWSVNVKVINGRLYLYAQRTVRDPVQRLEQLHRVILARMLEGDKPLEDDELVDHIDGNGLNNQRSNLRRATHAENNANTCKSINNTSGFKGVSFDVLSGKWKAYIRINSKQKTLGRFQTREEAYEAYCKAALVARGKFARFE